MRGATVFGGLAIDERGIFFDRMGVEARLWMDYGLSNVEGRGSVHHSKEFIIRKGPPGCMIEVSFG